MANRRVTKDESDAQIASAVLASFPLNKLDRILEAHVSDHDKVVVKGSNLIPLRIGNNWFLIDTDTNVSTAADLDAGVISNGKDYYVYACDSAGTLVFKISLASTFPAGFDATNSRKIGGFHTLCVAVGVIAGHTLTGYVANDILPASIWDLKHRPMSAPEGMAFIPDLNLWVDIYLMSGTGVNTKSVYNAAITDTRDWMNFVEDAFLVRKKLLDDDEFQAAAYGSNEETNISGDADPVTTGGHSDTAARRMISNYGLEDCCGALWQWLRTQSYRFDGAASHTHQVTVSGDPQTVTSGVPSGDVAPAWAYYDLGSKGSLYRQGTYGDVKLLAGGVWNSGSDCGSQFRHAASSRWFAPLWLGGRAASQAL